MHQIKGHRMMKRIITCKSNCPSIHRRALLKLINNNVDIRAHVPARV